MECVRDPPGLFILFKAHSFTPTISRLGCNYKISQPVLSEVILDSLQDIVLKNWVNRFTDRRIWTQKAHGLQIFW